MEFNSFTNYLNNDRYDIIHSHTPYAYAEGAIIYKTSFVPYDLMTRVYVHSYLLKVMDEGSPETDELPSYNELPFFVQIKRPFLCHNRMCIPIQSCYWGSLRRIMSKVFPNGIDKRFVPVLLKNVLKALEYFHGYNSYHGELNAGHILIDEAKTVRVAHGKSIFEDYGVRRMADGGLDVTDVFGGWNRMIPPEAMKDPALNKSKKADIWMLGITALELVNCQFPSEGRDKVMNVVEELRAEVKTTKMKKLMKGFSGSSSSNPSSSREVSKGFAKFVVKCLTHKTEKRPTATELLESKFFRECGAVHHFVDEFLLPNQGRFMQR